MHHPEDVSLDRIDRWSSSETERDDISDTGIRRGRKTGLTMSSNCCSQKGGAETSVKTGCRSWKCTHVCIIYANRIRPGKSSNIK